MIAAGLLHLAALIWLPGLPRPLTVGDRAFLLGFGSLYLIAAWAVVGRRRWGRWLAMAVSGIQAIPGVVLFYVLLVFSADPGSRQSLQQIGLLALLLLPLVVFAAAWLHRPGRP